MSNEYDGPAVAQEVPFVGGPADGQTCTHALPLSSATVLDGALYVLTVPDGDGYEVYQHAG